MTEVVGAAVAVLLRPDGQVLLAQRPAGKTWAGWWEFPGGKIEAGEVPAHALQRELDEELGIRVTSFSRWITRVFSYPERTVKLHFFLVRGWEGEPYGREGQLVCWQPVTSPEVGPLLPANAPVLEALRLPPVYAITNLAEMGETTFFRALERALQQGVRLIQVREKQLEPAAFLRFSKRVVAMARPYAARVVLNATPEMATAAGADGVHLPAAALMALQQKPEDLLCGASCHDADELERAAKLGLDYALLGPVQPTLTHPGQTGMGWQLFSQLTINQPMPVYALGGMTNAELPIAWQHGAHGIAMLRDAWRLTVKPSRTGC